MTRRVIVCGGRHFADAELLSRTLDAEHALCEIGVLIQGGARGADALASWWAFNAGVEREVYVAEWRVHGKAAGPLRNKRILEEGKPTVVIAFPGGAGTADMVARARAAGVRVIEVESSPPDQSNR